MAQRLGESMERIRAYAAGSYDADDGKMALDASGTEALLRQTLKQLQARVEQQEAALAKLRSQSDFQVDAVAYASGDPRKRLEQLITVRDAYQRLAPTVPFLPTQDSILPSLVAARSLQQNVQATKQAICGAQGRITKAETTLRQEEANLHDANLLAEAIKTRIQRLESQREDRSQRTAAQLARELIAAKRAEKERYDAEIQRLGKAMDDFINDYLSYMLAAEELGGPVVGDVLGVEDDMLAAGFTKTGKVRASKVMTEKTRQRRIDQIWGGAAGATVADEDSPPTEAEAADAEMRQLLGSLFAAWQGQGPGGGKGYHLLERDSAASRFLVRAKVAQFHPKDAKKLRLIDFGKELDD